MLIEVDELTWTRRRTRVLDSLCLTLRPGSVTGLVGPTGSGKTVTVKAMLGLIRAEGHVTFEGIPLTRHPVAARVVGVHFADAGLHPDRRVRDHLLMVAAASGLDRHRVDEILEVVGLTDLARSRPREMSRAMDHRIGMASALLPDPAALIVDGPLDGIDDETRTWLHEVLRARADAGGTVLVTDRSRGAVEGICDRVVALHQGRLDDITDVPDAVGADIRDEGPIPVAVQAGVGESAISPPDLRQESPSAAPAEPRSAPAPPEESTSSTGPGSESTMPDIAVVPQAPEAQPTAAVTDSMMVAATRRDDETGGDTDRVESAAGRPDDRAQAGDGDTESVTSESATGTETEGAADIRERSVWLPVTGSRQSGRSVIGVDVTAETDELAGRDTDPDGRDDVGTTDDGHIPEQRVVRLSDEVAGHHVPAKSRRSRRRPGSRRRSRSGGSRRGGSR